MHPGTANPALHALVARLVDYAGLFPPAALSMTDAVDAYAAYREAPESWMLGRFVVPVSRLGELAEAAAAYEPRTPWPIAVLGGADLEGDIRLLRAFNTASASRLVADVLEVKAGAPEAVAAAARGAGGELTVYVELPVRDDPRALVQAVRDAGVRAKVRTGGVTPEAFPTAQQLARFIARCAEAGVAFKATAGLHHPLRAEHRLTYEREAPVGTMFGFLNVFAAGAFARAGMNEDTLAALLEERDRRALVFGDDGLRWRGNALTTAQLAAARDAFAIAFGSCSFREPVDDLHLLGLL